MKISRFNSYVSYNEERVVMKNDKIEVHILLDNSPSMITIWEETIRSLQKFLEEQKIMSRSCLTSLMAYLFDSDFSLRAGGYSFPRV